MGFLNIIGAETGDGAETNNGSLAGNVTVVTTAPRTGAYHYRMTAVGGGVATQAFRGLNVAGAPADLGVATLYTCFHMRPVTIPTSSDEEILTVFNDSAALANIWSLRLDSAGHVNLYRGDFFGSPSLVTSGTTVISTGSYYRIEFKAGVGATAAYELRIDGTTEYSGTGDMTGVTVNNYVQIGKSRNHNSQSIEIYVDDIAIRDDDWVGAGQVNRMAPDGIGTNNTWTSSSGGAKNTDVDDIPHNSDTDYIFHNGAGAQEQGLTLESASAAGVSGDIKTVKAIGIVKRVTGGAGTGMNNIGVRSAGALSTTSNGVQNATSYTTQAKIYDTNPADAAAWESGDLDALEVVARTAGAATDSTLRVTAIMTMVWSTGSSPVSIAGITATMSTGVLLPTIITSSNVSIAGETAELDLDAPIPIVTAEEPNVSIAAEEAIMDLAANNPDVSTGATISGNIAEITMEVNIPAVIRPITVASEPAEITLEASNPDLSTEVVIAGETAELTLEANEPVISSTGKAVIDSPVAEMTLAVIPSSIVQIATIIADVATMTLNALTPHIVITFKEAIIKGASKVLGIGRIGAGRIRWP